MQHSVGVFAQTHRCVQAPSSILILIRIAEIRYDSDAIETSVIVLLFAVIQALIRVLTRAKVLDFLVNKSEPVGCKQLVKAEGMLTIPEPSVSMLQGCGCQLIPRVQQQHRQT